MNVVLIHPWDTKKAENHVMHFEADAKTNDRMNDGKNGTVKEKESGHRASVMPIR